MRHSIDLPTRFVASAIFISVICGILPTNADEPGWCIQTLDNAVATLKAQEREHGTNSVLVVPALIAFGDACVNINDLVPAAAAFSRAAELQQQLLKNINHDLRSRIELRVIALNRLGAAYLKLRKFNLAENAFNAAMANAAVSMPSSSDAVKIARNGFALARAYRIRHVEQVDFYKTLLKATEKAFGKQHAQVALVLDAQIWTLLALGKTAPAEKTAKRMVTVRRAAMPPNHPETADALNKLASIYCERGKPKQAVPLLQEALQIRRAAFGTGHPITVLAIENLAAISEETGDLEAAARYRNAAATSKRPTD